MANFYYPQFDVITIDTDGFRQIADGEDVDFYNITQDVLIDTLTTDANGILAKGSFSNGSFPVADKDVVELRHATLPGTARFILTASEELAVLVVENHITTYVLDDESDTQEADAVRVFAQDLSSPDMAPIDLGSAKTFGQTTLPFESQDGEQYRIYIAKVHKDWEFHAATPEQLSGLELNVGTGVDSPPTFTSVAYDSANSEVDLVFAKNGSATGNIQVEYKLTSSGSWTTHPTDFAHGATSGSVVITEQPTPLTYDIRLKQAGISGYSSTRQVTVDAATGGGTPPSDLSGVETFITGPPDEYDVQLDWTAGSGSGDYTVERKTGSGGSWSVLTASETASPYTDAAVVAINVGRTYYYRVKQNDVTGYSNEASVYIPRTGS